MTRDPQRLETILGHIVDSIASVESYIANLDFDQFLGDQRTQEAVLFNLVVIGEASREIERLFPDYFQEHRDTPLIDAYRMRNRIVHGYSTIDLETVWFTAT
jgi:uncharacterized protein with HEPN domain